ncbi:MAG: 4-(cytidine 5'-diphospho)-2-C-methyl-D-erythritol kinase [Bdellovibrionota bacterium]|nr:MAG: 4-(cytidine 5'-diphospho)-2-C-methyl-D-erythritol kinase [Bdellovibrionota bacterium]
MSTPNASDSAWFSGFAPAKLNVRLKVRGRRADGYHLLSMLNVPLGLRDTVRIRFSPQNRDSCTCHGPYGPSSGEPTDNSVLKMANLFRAHIGAVRHVECEIDKQIPVQAGLGGGSSDAATALLLLEALFQRELSPAQRQMLAAKAGSDVSYFLWSKPAWVRGVGEVVEPIELGWLNGWPCALIIPSFGLSTAQVYAQLRYGPWQEFAAGADASLDAVGLTGASASAASFFDACIENDLLEAAIELEPRLSAILRAANGIAALRNGMTGSGSALFSLPLDRHQGVEELFNRLEATVQPLGARCLRTQIVWNHPTR